MARSAKDTKAPASAAKQALIELRRMQAKLDAMESARTEGIAICGMGLRLPGAAVDAETYWQLLSEGVDAITEVPPSRWDVDALYDADPDVPGKMYTRHGGFIEHAEDFDAEFFGLSPREARRTDPQQRLLLEVAWEALENAAIAPSELVQSRSGVFVGVANSDFGRLQLRDTDSIDMHTSTGGSLAVLAGRLSYVLGLNGPSAIVDTACSSSLTAIALACESLRRKECDLALAGGSNLILTPEYNIAFSKARMLAPDGRCKTFDARADGYVRGEGCAVIVLKRLSDALASDDPILAVIRGIAVNQDGPSSGLTVPNGPAQEAVVRSALKNGGVEANDVAYVEAHGTATELGDPIEVHALGAVFGSRPAEEPLSIGSVKTNIGHLEAAAGIAGVIKVVLAMRHGEIPPSLHFKEPSPQIDWQRCHVNVPTELTEWPTRSGTRLAGVSSFGFSGTNAHVILEQAPARDMPVPAAKAGAQLLALSARSPDALRELVARYAAFLGAGATLLADVAWSAATGRSHLSHRLAVIAGDQREMQQRLSEFSQTGHTEFGASGRWFDSDAPPVSFLFTGDRSQYRGMARDYYERFAVFRETLDECDRLIRHEGGESLLDCLIGDDAGQAWSEPAEVGQPALFAMQVALAAQWRAWGIEPSAVFGYGLGEYAAACVAGVFALETGLALTRARGRLFDATSPMRLMAVSSSTDALSRVAGYESDGLGVVAENGPQSTIVAGKPGALDALAVSLNEASIGFHDFGDAPISPNTGSAEFKGFRHVVENVEFAEPELSIVSSQTGDFAETELTEAANWVAEPQATIRFCPGVRCLQDDGQSVFLEIGPHPTLVAMARQWSTHEGSVWASASHRESSVEEHALNTIATLYAHGVDPDWTNVLPPSRPRIALPCYPFQRERFSWENMQGAGHARRELPCWDHVVAAGRQQASVVPIDMDVRSYGDKWRCLEDLTTAYMVQTFAELGLFGSNGEAHSVGSLVARGGIKSVYAMLMSRWLEHLVEAGRLQRQGEQYRCVDAFERPELEPLLDAAKASLSDIPELLEYVRRCGNMLTDILLDRESPLQSLFPGGSNDTARFLYRDWALPRYINQTAAAVVDRFVDIRATTRPVRLLEIGAGTGATTASVLPPIAWKDVTYAFTDVSDFFLAQAQQEFAEYPFVQYGLFDASEDPATQGYGRHGFDVVIAANVLHATSNLEDTTDHVLSLLAPGGMLVLVEATEPPVWSDITVSLIEGWQSFADSLRTDSPLLPAARWSDLLHARGFDEVIVLPEKGSLAEVFGSNVIVAHVREDRLLGAETQDDYAVEMAVVSASAALRTENTSTPDAEAAAKLRRALDAAAPNERADLLVDYVRESVNRVLRRDPGKSLDRRQRLMDLGVDSLMAVELRNMLTTGLALEEPLPATLIFDYPSVEAVASHLYKCLETPDADERDTKEPGPVEESVIAMSEDDVEQLSDDEVKAMLKSRIGEE